MCLRTGLCVCAPIDELVHWGGDYDGTGLKISDPGQIAWLLLERLAHICPSLRNVSMPRPSSCARRLRDGDAEHWNGLRNRGNLRPLVFEETGVIISTRSGLQNSICTCLNNTVMQISAKTMPTILKTFFHRTDYPRTQTVRVILCRPATHFFALIAEEL